MTKLIPERADRIRTLLSDDVLRFCSLDEIIQALKNQGANESTAVLREALSSPDSDGKLRLYSAIVLAIFNDPAGLEVLKDPNKHYLTNSEIESLHALAGRILLGDASPGNGKIGINWRQMSPQLTAEIATP